ncbi:putative DNA recombinase CisA [Paenibacillus larvae subsp. larvae DSM 25719]|uniref:recombinase family protein n=1 Tax=Paenibacillus larvae TaxID=1464 RepID=UPI0003DDB9C4|nr:recombinase family protein [Paenibacillus larvae]ETK29925.1 putative DNA recombinase CisA [Paenibacillus larvae subsp. larvae DSM 25719]
MRVAAYVRVSTDEQADKGNSLSEQKERLSAYCKAMGWNTPIFFVDDGYSAKDLNRPAIKKLLQSVKSKEYDIVLTSKLDRLTRSLLDLLHVVNMFGEYNCNYVSATESFDTSTAVGRMVLQLLGVFAEFERERISERVSDNMISLAKHTDKALGKVCYGYDVVDGKYIINEIEADFVRLMFDLAEQGNGHRMIAKELNDRGSVTKKGKMWDQTNVRRLIQNESLAGIMIYNKRQTKNGKITMRPKSDWIIKENNHPAIISPERFQAVQEIMQSRSRARKHADSETYLLTGLVVCKHCGKGMKGATSRHKTKYGDYTYYRYICSSYVAGYNCKHHIVHRDDLETLIVEQIKLIAESSAKQLKLDIAASNNQKDELEEIKQQLAKTDKKMQRQIEAFENDLISAADLRTARERVEAEREGLRKRLERLENGDKKEDVQTVISKAKGLLDEIMGVDRVKAKAAIRLLIEQIQVENGEMVSITWKG